MLVFKKRKRKRTTLYNGAVFSYYEFLLLSSALLWHRLMGTGVLEVDTDASPELRIYAHCSKGRVRLYIC